MRALAWPRRFAGPLFVLSLVANPIAGGDAIARPAPPPRAPEAIYAKTCGYCHGARVAPVIRGRKLPVEVITSCVRSGPRAMPAFRPTEISNAELAALAKWISTSKADPKEIGE